MSNDTPLPNPMAEFAANQRRAAGTAITPPQTPPPEPTEPEPTPTPTATTTTPPAKRGPRRRKTATDKIVALRMKDDLYHALHKAAHDNNMHLSTYVRAAIDQYADQLPKKVTETPRRLRAADITRYSLKLSPTYHQKLHDVAAATGHPLNTAANFCISQAVKDNFTPVIEDDWASL